MDNSWRSKAPVIFIAVLVMGWVLADAMNVRLPTDSRIPTVDSLLANNADVESMKSMLCSMPVHDTDAADRIADCLLHENVQLRQAARSIAHDRLDKWQLDSPEDQSHLVRWLSGSVRRLRDSGALVTVEGREITQRMYAMAQRPTFADRESCVSDCLAVLEPNSVLGSTEANPPLPPGLKKRLTESIAAPVNYEFDLGVLQKPE